MYPSRVLSAHCSLRAGLLEHRMPGASQIPLKELEPSLAFRQSKELTDLIISHFLPPAGLV